MRCIAKIEALEAQIANVSAAGASGPAQGEGEEVEALKKAVEEEKGKAVKLEEEVAALKKAAEEGKGQYDQSVVNVRPRHHQAPTNVVNK